MQSPRASMARKSDPSVLVFGVGSFAHSHMQIFREAGTHVSTCLTRKYGHYPPSLVGERFNARDHPSPLPLLKEHAVDFLLPPIH